MTDGIQRRMIEPSAGDASDSQWNEAGYCTADADDRGMMYW